MLAQSAGSWTAAVTAVVALLGAILGVLRYFNYRTKRDRIAAVGAAFETVVAALASESEIKQLAAAIRLRRFFDPGSEVGAAGAAYSRDALGVIVAILREQPTGNLQKLLADGLTHAPTLVGADLQRTNLQGAYLGRANVSGADFYRADLSGASLKRAVAQGTVFYQAKLVRTVCSGADFAARTSMGPISHVSGSREHCSPRPRLWAVMPFPGGRLPSRREWPVYRPGWTAAIRPTSSHCSSTGFRESPSTLTSSQQAVWRLVEDTLEAAGAEVVTFARSEYPPAGVLSELRRVMADCQGVVVLGFRQLDIYAGSWRPDTPEASSVAGAAAATPWNQVEAGMAAALGLPVFILRDPGVTGGVFDIKEDVVTVVADLGVALERSPARTSLQRWLSELVR